MIGPAALLTALFALATTVGPTSDTRVTDLPLYGVYSALVRGGAVPYRDFGFEYPPLALGPITVAGWPVAFAVLMLLALLAAQWCCFGLAGPTAAWLFALTPLLAGALVRTHFDAVPAALSIAAVLAVTAGRPRLGLGLLGVGAMTKLYPVILVPPALGWLVARGRRREAWQGAAIAAAVCVVCLAPFPAGGLVDTVHFHLDRPVQIESTPATLLFALGESHVTGDPVRHDAFKSNGLAGGAADAVDAAFLATLAVALLGCVVLALAGADLALACLLALLCFVALGKVLSPQYMVWLAPFAAVAWTRGARVAAALTAAAIALTQVEFPVRYFDLVHRDTAMVLVVAARNALLLAAAVTLAAGLARSRPRAWIASSAPPRR